VNCAGDSLANVAASPKAIAVHAVLKHKPRAQRAKVVDMDASPIFSGFADAECAVWAGHAQCRRRLEAWGSPRIPMAAGAGIVPPPIVGGS
jgi:hypothetical protein